ncbi:hypothetical protein JCM14713_29440 [Desulfomicrobium salsuginis]
MPSDRLAAPPGPRVEADGASASSHAQAVETAQPSLSAAEPAPHQGAALNSTALATAGGLGQDFGGGASGPGHSPTGGGIGTAPVNAAFGDSDGPRFVRRVLPRYPEAARRKGREGRVVLRLVIGACGELKDAAVVEGGEHGFEEAALEAARASVYAPAVRGGRAVECAAMLPIRFSLKGG